MERRQPQSLPDSHHPPPTTAADAAEVSEDDDATPTNTTTAKNVALPGPPRRNSYGAQSSSGDSHDNTRDQIIEADSEVSDDSASELSSTRSVRDSVFDFVYENGRRYHRYAQGSYILPNDDLESDRLNLQHWVFRSLFTFRDYFAPLKEPKRILDIGTGTGNWAISIAHDFPDAEIIGTDLSPIQPVWVPPNVSFLIDDASNEDWGSKRYDYIHTRMLLGSFDDFRDIIKRSFKYLEPGGWMESQEAFPTPYCDDGTMPANHPFLDWTQNLDEAAMQIGKPLRIANKLKKWYEQAGFVDVHEEVFKLPINAWPRDPRFKMLGRFWETQLLDGLQGFSLALFHRAFGWTKEAIEVYLVNVRKAIQDRKVHAYYRVYVVWGRKPLDQK